MSAKQNPTTRERLLESACALFAEKGFSKTTHREISDRAGANSAAVNYYFGSKEKLYAEAWRTAFHESLQAHPPDGNVSPDAPPEERLRGRIEAHIGGMTDKNNRAFRIAHHEMANPTALLHEVMHECMHPLQNATKGLVRELLGPQATEQQVRFCEVSVISQCMDVAMRSRPREFEDEHAPPPMTREEVEAYIDHVTEFSLAAMRALRNRIERDTSDD